MKIFMMLVVADGPGPYRWQVVERQAGGLLFTIATDELGYETFGEAREAGNAELRRVEQASAPIASNDPLA